MPGNRKKVLFVDDDADLLDLLRQLMSRFAGDSWEVLIAADVTDAMMLLQQRNVDLLVLDIRMPLVDGVQFLGILQRKYPNLLKAVLTGEATDERRSACLGNGAELFLEKPRDEGGWRAVYAMLNELVKLQPDDGFRGVLRHVGLQDVLQMECLARNSAVLQVRAGDKHGAVYVKTGQIVHAELGDASGERAFNELLTLAGGEFDLRPWSDPRELTISGSWEFLLMEAARARDEKASGASLSQTDSPFVRSADIGHEKPGSTVVPVVAAQPSSLESDTENPLPTQPENSDQSRPTRIEELLIASPQGEVLHEWQCANTTGRVVLLDHVAKLSRQIGKDLPLGAFDRLEINTASTRVIVQIQPDRGMFLRTSRNPVESEAGKLKP